MARKAGDIAFREAPAAVFDLNGDGTPEMYGPDFDSTALVSKFDGVTDQVADRRAEQSPVPVKGSVSGTSRMIPT
jgi:hypothetical protein